MRRKKALPGKEHEDKHELQIHLQKISPVPSFPKPVHYKGLQHSNHYISKYFYNIQEH